MQKVRKQSGLFSTHIVRRLINITAEIHPVKGNQPHIATLENDYRLKETNIHSLDRLVSENPHQHLNNIKFTTES